jgi:hypothetical protein
MSGLRSRDLKRYGSGFSYVLQLPVSEGLGLIQQAIKKASEEKAWELWVSLVPHMDQAHIVSFDQFLAEMKEEPVKHVQSSISVDEIISKAERIKHVDQGRSKQC